MKQALFAVFPFVAVFYFVDFGMARALDFQSDFVLETPDDTYAEITACLYKKGAFKMPPPAFQAANEDCQLRAKGLTVIEFQAMCWAYIFTPDYDDEAKENCFRGVEKLRPQFKREAAPSMAVGLTAVEFIAIDSGCALTADSKEKARCESGVRKLKNLLIKPPPKAKD
jgi:hypothetical protein